MTPTAIGIHQPLAGLAVASDNKNDLSTYRRPDRNPDHHARIVLESDLVDGGAVSLCDPQIAVATAIGQVNHFVAVRTDRGGLRLTGLSRDPDCISRVFRGRSGGGKFPDVGLNPNLAGHDLATAGGVRFHI